MRTHIRICMYIYTCMYICTYTYTHTYLGGVAKDAEAERQEKQRIELQESLRQQVLTNVFSYCLLMCSLELQESLRQQVEERIKAKGLGPKP